MSWAAAIGQVAGMGPQVANAIYGIKNYNYQKKLQKRIFEREDNAVQRRAADLEKAGLSKTLAAGSAAGAGATVPVEKPDFSGISQGINDAMAMAQTFQNISKSRSEQRLLKAQETKSLNEAAKAWQQARLEKHDADVMQGKNSLYRSPSMPGKIIRDFGWPGEGGKVNLNTIKPTNPKFTPRYWISDKKKKEALLRQYQLRIRQFNKTGRWK